MKEAADPMVYTEDGKSGKRPMHNMTGTWQGALSLLVFIAGYTAAIMEESVGHGFKKSIPITLAAGIIWVLVALGYRDKGHSLYFVTTAARHNLTEFVEVFLFLLCAMTFINTMHRLNVFNKLRWFLVESGFSYRSCFWITGLIAFWLSPIADNLTTAVLMGAVISNLGHGYDEYVAMCCVNIVVAANAGGAFSPFGDLTTLMVWQKGKVRLEEFPGLLAPAVVNWLVPAFLMNRRIKDAVPPRVEGEVAVQLLPGAVEVILLFVATVFMTACFHSYAHLPPVLGMMTGLGMLKVYGWKVPGKGGDASPDGDGDVPTRRDHALDIFKRLEQTEWDTLIFFYGVIMCVGGLGVMGYLSALSTFMYGNFGPNIANVALGALSAVIDNIPMTYAVLQTDPLMTTTQWLLLTLTAGVGGSLLAVGSAAGVGLMGVNSRCYTFRSHLRWTPAVALGYLASVVVHLAVNGFE
ncbi:NhaD Na+:H+ antiporter family [Micromonas commoda]|uniref:NhaD Na+:H+ antiporter family n=1 Tax=Micromonas commoda (strain RCC299 / NOUM17 / CCMP2709) TaxID=296587 RepID=C1FGS1_MICCC|nr:NhaD Na+:H+ antiporter family [Micromonas commoda]ACO69311.1 NhaD Na+:H+ antiporter family [Micromonas commoda]|eukprot:XP_002508053.1 NhaD Na+:H+ antiporter family [Micromonas commoda]